MATSHLEAINQLNTSASLPTQITALKHIKNGLIGYAENKEQFLRHGLVDALINVLAAASRTRSKSKGTQAATSSSTLLDEDEVRLQVLLLLGSLINGGPSFVPPILASPVVSHLQLALDPEVNDPRIIVAALRLLDAFAQSSSHSSPTAESFQQSAALDTLYSQQSIQLFVRILMQKIDSTPVQEELSLVCAIIAHTCVTEQQQAALVAGGVLEVLGARLASYHVFTGRSTRGNTLGLLPPPNRSILSNVLAAVAAIVRKSRSRTARFLHSPLMDLVFPRHKPELYHDRNAAQDLNSGSAPADFVSPIERSLPQVHPLYTKDNNTFSKMFPSSGFAPPTKTPVSFDSLHNSSSGSNTPGGSTSTKRESGDESSFVSWLIQMFRQESGPLKLQAARFLASLKHTEFTSATRDRMLALLIVPVLMSLLEDALKQVSSTKPQSAESRHQAEFVLEEAAEIASSLIVDNILLQNAAIDAGAAKKACQLLKYSFEPLDPPPQIWPKPDTVDTAMVDDVPATRLLGAKGLPHSLVHALKCRAAALSLVAALAARDDKYRKQLLADPIVSPGLFDSLTAFNSQALENLNPLNKDKIQPKLVGNDIRVLAAALNAIKNFARSVTLLRTNLLDAGISKPVAALLKHSNAEVVKQATDVCVNIANEFSPMREALVNQDTIKILCDHAHSADSSLRHVSLMALKNVCNKAPHDVKMQCFKGLGTGRLLQIISGGNNAATSSNRTARSTPSLTMGGNAAGERVDMLNAAEPDPMDVIDERPIIQSIASLSNTEEFTVSEELLTQITPTTSTINAASLITEYLHYLHTLREHQDLLASSTAYADELRMQATGFDFLRNLTFGDDNVQTLDEVFREINANRLFEIMLSKLKSPQAASGNSSTSSVAGLPLPPSAYVSSPPADCTATEASAVRHLTTCVIYVLVHIAAGTIAHRSQLIAQQGIMDALLQLLSHSDPEIRSRIIWIIINLTYPDDVEDAQRARGRAQQLRNMGWEERLKEIKETDTAVDVRERASTAVEQLRGLPSGRGYSESGGSHGRSGSGHYGSPYAGVMGGRSG